MPHFSKGEYAERLAKTRAAMDAQDLDGMLLFAPESHYWLTGYDTFGFCFFQCMIVPRDGDPLERLKAFEQAGVLVSLENLMTFPFIQKAVEEERLHLHGAWFDIATGTLHHYDTECGEFQPSG